MKNLSFYQEKCVFQVPVGRNRHSETQQCNYSYENGVDFQLYAYTELTLNEQFL